MEAAQMEDGGSNKAGICRQSSTRWTPTSDQIRILKELYYNNGVRSPSAEQIQRICLQLRKYGKIEGKNVFYWFQNHKARERQKKRFTSEVHHHVPINVQRAGLVIGNTTTANNYNKPDDHYINKYSTNSCQGVSSASAPCSVISVNGQMGNYGGYGSMTMEKSFRDCSISTGTATASVDTGGSIGHNFGSWVGAVDPYPSYTASTNFCCNKTPFLEEVEEGEEEEEYHQEIETLPLFPMHAGDHIFGNMKATSDGVGGYGYCSGGWGSYNGGASLTSLELSLNSYGYNTANYY